MPTKKEIQDLYFMDARFKLLEIASFLDRVDRHEGDADFRHPAFAKALATETNSCHTYTSRTDRVLFVTQTLHTRYTHVAGRCDHCSLCASRGGRGGGGFKAEIKRVKTME